MAGNETRITGAARITNAHTRETSPSSRGGPRRSWLVPREGLDNLKLAIQARATTALCTTTTAQQAQGKGRSQKHTDRSTASPGPQPPHARGPKREGARLHDAETAWWLETYPPKRGRTCTSYTRITETNLMRPGPGLVVQASPADGKDNTSLLFPW
jgi:hypothetical protein